MINIFLALLCTTFSSADEVAATKDFAVLESASFHVAESEREVNVYYGQSDNFNLNKSKNTDNDKDYFLDFLFDSITFLIKSWICIILFFISIALYASLNPVVQVTPSTS